MHGFRPESERRSHAATICDPTRSDNGDRNGIAHGGNKRHGGELADMTARLAALCDNRIGAATLHPSRKGARCNDGYDLASGFLPHLDVGRRAAGARRDHVDAQIGEQFGDLCRIGVHEHDVYADGLIGCSACKAHLLLDPGKGGGSRCDDAKATRFADRSGKACIGNPCHRSLDYGILDSQKLGYPRLHGLPLI